uniref:Uncharacterized protein n=1 Tax=Oryza barthii TaxID=65489 RepID=A0A0D3FMB9_9ORYZ
MAGAMEMTSLGVRMYDLTDQHIEAALTNLIAGLESEYKFEVNPVLIKVILGVAMSVDEVQDRVSQLISCKGYFGRGGCCGKDRLRAFSSCCIESEALETVECLIKSTVNELSEPVDRDPVIFVLEEPAAATATTTMTLPLPRYRHVASPPPPVHAGVAGLGDEQQPEQLGRRHGGIMAGAMEMPSLGVRMYDLTDQHIGAALTNLIAGLESEYKFEVNPVLIKVILGVAMSVDEVQDCVSQLISCKGYFGRGGCCGKDRLRAFSSCCIESEALETVECLTKSTVNELSEPVDRDPVIFVLEEPAAATATTTMTLTLPRYRHVASPPPPVHAGVAGLGDEQQLE